jgi:site-specific DNA-cytosine methylase
MQEDIVQCEMVQPRSRFHPTNCTTIVAGSPVDVTTLPDADMLIGGPSCQPFSDQGAQQGWHDPRAGTFVACIDAITHLASRSSSKLAAFVIENVSGISRSAPTWEKCPLLEVSDMLQDELGTSWDVRHYWIEALPKFDRMLTVAEKAILQGFSSDLSERLRRETATRIIGNAMSVPAVGVVVAALCADYVGPL